MPFTGKATYSAGDTLPEIAEDVSDIIAIISPHETPLLDHLGEPHRGATSTVHEWLEDALLPNTDAVDDQSISNAITETTFTVENGDRFTIGDQIMLGGKAEVMLVTGVSGNDLTVVRQYGGSTSAALADDDEIIILGNAALEGDDAPAVRFTNRVRKQNFTQIFTKAVEVSGSQSAVQSIGVEDELDYQKQERLRELLRDLENSVINGVAASSTPEGDSSTRRTMRGIQSFISTHLFEPGTGDMPDGGGAGSDELTEELLNAALRVVWEQSAARIDTIVCNGFQKRKINEFIATNQRFTQGTDRFRQMVEVYESDFGVCRVVMSRYVPAGEVLLLDSSRIDVLPLVGRSFQYKPLASTGDAERGQMLGEYTLEMRNEAAHAKLFSLASS